MRQRLVKLVRDKIGSRLGSDTVQYAPMSDREYQCALRAKLLEEVGEYLLDPTIGELADVYEVVRALAKYRHGIDINTLLTMAESKRYSKGGLDERIGMYVTTTAKEG